MPSEAACFANSPRWGGESLCQLFLILNSFFGAFGLVVPPKGEIKKNDVLEKKVFSFSIVDSIYIGLSTCQKQFSNCRKPV